MQDNEIEQLRTTANLNWGSIVSTDNNSIIGSIQPPKYTCPAHGELLGWPTQIASSKGPIMICWKCIGDFYAENMPKVKPL